MAPQIYILAKIGKIVNVPQLIGTQPSPFKGLGIRFLAAMIDFVLIFFAIFAGAIVLGIFFGSLFGEDAGFGAGFLAFFVIGIATQLLYKPLMESSEYEGTFGKYFLNIKVVDKHGRRIAMTKSFIRTTVYLLQTSIPILSLISWLAFLMIAFTEENQGLHDMAAETYVVSKYWDGPVPLQDKFGA
jgi:uncharacterized RDD family membrane protein YckC